MNDIYASTESCTPTIDFEYNYKQLVQIIVQTRTQAGFSQQFLADWINVDRRKIIEFETALKYDIPILLQLCDKLSIELELNFKQY